MISSVQHIEGNPCLAFLGASPGPFEILILCAAVLILFGANRLPELFRTLGKFSAELKRASEDFRYQLMEIPEEVSSIKEELENDLKDLTVSRNPAPFDLDDTDDGDGQDPEAFKRPDEPTSES